MAPPSGWLADSAGLCKLMIRSVAHADCSILSMKAARAALVTQGSSAVFERCRFVGNHIVADPAGSSVIHTQSALSHRGGTATTRVCVVIFMHETLVLAILLLAHQIGSQYSWLPHHACAQSIVLVAYIFCRQIPSPPPPELGKDCRMRLS